MDNADDDLQEFENAVSNADDAKIEPDTVQLICSVCGKQKFQRISLIEKRRLRWRPTQFPKSGSGLLKMIIPGRIIAYRCLHCDYIMMFARD